MITADINPGPAAQGSQNLYPQNTVTGIYTFATLPTASSVAAGTLAYTSDQGLVVSNQVSWSAVTQSSTSYTTNKSRAVLIGDSLLANCFSNVQINTTAGGFVVNRAGIATVSTSSTGAHSVNPFNYFHIYNTGQSPSFLATPYYS